VQDASKGPVSACSKFGDPCHTNTKCSCTPGACNHACSDVCMRMQTLQAAHRASAGRAQGTQQPRQHVSSCSARTACTRVQAREPHTVRCRRRPGRPDSTRACPPPRRRMSMQQRAGRAWGNHPAQTACVHSACVAGHGRMRLSPWQGLVHWAFGWGPAHAVHVMHGWQRMRSRNGLRGMRAGRGPPAAWPSSNMHAWVEGLMHARRSSFSDACGAVVLY